MAKIPVSYFQFHDIVKEHFDLSDHRNRKIILALDEADQASMLVSLSSKLYESIINKVDDIDYNGIPNSRGDITKIPNFVEITDCLNTIRELVVYHKQSTEQVDVILTAIENMKASRKTWERGFVLNYQFPVVFYNTICLSIVSATSLLISASIEFLQDPTDAEGSFSTAFDKVGYVKTKNHLLFKNLKGFNKAYQKGDIVKTMEDLMKSQKSLQESKVVEEDAAVAVIAGVITGMALFSMIKLILPILQECVCFLYCTRQNVADWFTVQSALVSLNAEKVKMDVTKTPSERKTIHNKQVKIAETLKKISNKLNITMKSGEKQAEAMVKEERTKKYKVEDVSATMPASASSIF